MQLDRNTLFALLGALEEDLRFIIEAHLLTTHHEEQILGHAYDKALERLVSDDTRDHTQTGVVDYLDLGDELEILQRWSNDLPAQTRDSLRSQSDRLTDLVTIRNRVVHRRPLLVDDYAKAQQILQQLDRDGFEGSALKEALRHLREDPGWTPVGPIPSFDANTLNNLPLGDYDETGLIGRRRELERLSKQLTNLSSSRRGPVLTVIGPGGVGKTALALQALHDLVNDEACPYDIVSWVSLKTEQLTARGIQSIHDAVMNIEQAMPAFVEALDPTFSGTAKQLADSLAGLTALIVIDNLETISGREVLELIDTLPETVSYLITSRQGLGEVERRFPLAPLKQRYAVDLLRRLARARGLQSYAQMKTRVAEGLVSELGASPLGLKWFISSVEVGKDPSELLHHKEDLVRFCVENVFASLSNEAKTVGSVLHILARPATVQDMRLYLPEMSTDRLRASIHALNQRMLIRHDFVADSISETFEATEPLSDYLRFADLVDAQEVARVQEADEEYRRQEERHRLDAAHDPLRPNIIRGDKTHRASVLLLRNAMSQSKRGQVEEALERIREAADLDPEFWEIHRVRAFILSSNRQVDQATTAYLRAIELAPNDVEAARVKYFFAGHLSRRSVNSERATIIAQEAHNVLDTPRTAVELGRALTYVGDFQGAENILQTAIGTDDIRTRLIATTQLVDCMRRRAETEAMNDRQPDKAVRTIAKAIEIASTAVQQGVVDKQLTEKTVQLASDMLRSASNCREEQPTGDLVRVALTSVQQLGRDVNQCRNFGYLIGHARQLMLHRPTLAEQVPLIALYARHDEAFIPSFEVVDQGDDATLLGAIRAWKADRHFGFIAPLDGTDDCYFDRAALANASDEIHLHRGVTVRFNRSVVPNRRNPQAFDVRVEEYEAHALQGRRLLVDRLHNSGNCLFSTDIQSGATVFVGRHAMSSDSEWRSVDIGANLESEVEIDRDGRFRAAGRSTRIVS